MPRAKHALSKVEGTQKLAKEKRHMNIIGRRVILILTVLATVLSNFAYAQDKSKGSRSFTAPQRRKAQ